jgi:predicted dehydrogenase
VTTDTHSSSPPTPPSPERGDAIRYAVVGLGYISQVAMLPAFAHARENSRLTALVSSDAAKRDALSKKYKVKHTFATDDYEACLKSGEIDAVYLALPNHLHRDYAVRAAEAGIHVLCEKPMAVSEADCESMIRAAQQNGVKLMIAYRLHFDEANLDTIAIAQSAKLGELRAFNSVFTMSVAEGNIRLSPISQGGGTLYDVGIYCINAARYLFQAEPEEVFATSASYGDARFSRCDGTTSVLLRFPGQRLASFTCSFGAADVSSYQLVGTRGDVRLDPAYDYAMALKRVVTVDGKKAEERTFGKHDQFAPELVYFSECIRNDQQPEPSGWEGLADVRVIRAAYESASKGQPVRLPAFERKSRPTLAQQMCKPPVKPPELIHSASPSGG